MAGTPLTVFCPSSIDGRIVFLARSPIQEGCLVGERGGCWQGEVFYNFFKKSEPFLLAFHPSVVSHNVVVKFLWLSLCCHQRFALKGSGVGGCITLLEESP